MKPTVEHQLSEIPLPQSGETLANKYLLGRVIGRGGMGVVFEATHLRLRQRVAIKMLLPSALAIGDLVTRFEREARATATIESAHVAKVLDVDTTPSGLPFMVIEYLEGRDLSQELAGRGALPIEEAVGLVLEACVPIAQAHALGIVHRDLKPSNLFLAIKGEERVLKLLDFGISKILTDTDSKATSSLHGLGTPHYMSPEQVRHAAEVDHRSDIWSLGVILYELLTGTEPYKGTPSAIIAAIVTERVPPPRARRPDIPIELERVVMRALEKRPDDRFQDIGELASALAPFGPDEELVPKSRARPLPKPISHGKIVRAAMPTLDGTPSHARETARIPRPIADSLSGVVDRVVEPTNTRWLPLLVLVASVLTVIAMWRQKVPPHPVVAAPPPITVASTSSPVVPQLPPIETARAVLTAMTSAAASHKPVPPPRASTHPSSSASAKVAAPTSTNPLTL
jgi:eukaryotic-like serine/threonine-protein kinase